MQLAHVEHQESSSERVKPASFDFFASWYTDWARFFFRIAARTDILEPSQHARSAKGATPHRTQSTNLCVGTVPDPKIEHGRDAIIKVSTCAICGSDLHLFDGFMPTMKSGDIMGHEFMGEVVEVGSENKALKVGDRVVVPFTIICGECEQTSLNFERCSRLTARRRQTC